MEPLESLPKVLTRRGCPGYLPPRLHFGFPIEIEDLCQVAEKHCGYTKHLTEPRNLRGESFETYAFIRGYDYIVNNFSDDAKLEMGFLNGDSTIILSLTDNFIGLRDHDSQHAEKVQKLLGRKESAKWYLDTEIWHWRRG